MSAAATVDIWYNNPVGCFLDAENATRILPERGTTLTEQLNALMRFAVYLAVLLAIFKRSAVPAIYVFCVAAVVTAALDYHDRMRDETKDALMERLNVQQRPHAKTDGGGEYCTLPSKTNPFMNVLPSDYAKFPARPAACDLADPGVTDDVEANFARKTFRDSDDVYGRTSGSSRQFYTMPVTTIPNDQVSFAHWLYRSNDIDGVCRDEDALACTARIHAQRPGM